MDDATAVLSRLLVCSALAASTEGLQFTFFANKESGKMEGIEKDSVSLLYLLPNNGLKAHHFLPFSSLLVFC